MDEHVIRISGPSVDMNPGIYSVVKNSEVQSRRSCRHHKISRDRVEDAGKWKREKKLFKMVPLYIIACTEDCIQLRRFIAVNLIDLLVVLIGLCPVFKLSDLSLGE